MKAVQNWKAHRVSFEEALEDPLARYDPDLDHGEVRINVIGCSSKRLLFVVCVEREAGDMLRIFSARKATPEERREYADG